MNGRLGIVAVMAAAIGLAVLAAATADPGLASELAVAGAALAALGGVLLLLPIVRPPFTPRPPIVGSSLVLLRDAFRSGPLGRQAIVANVVSLELRDDAKAAGLNPEEERRILALDAAGFRAWLDGRLERLERET